VVIPLVALTIGTAATPAAAASAPGLSLAKSASVSSYAQAGTAITYTYQVINTGSTTLNNVTVTDPMAGLSAITCPGGNPIPSLAPGHSVTCTATYTTTQADVDAGSISNTGTATAQGAAGPITATSSVTIPAAKGPSIGIVKTASVSDFSAAGQSITYTYVVTNTGNQTLDDIVVSDGSLTVTCPGGNPIASLAPGASVTCTATYTTTATDVENGSITNVATAATDSPVPPNVSANASLTIPEVGPPFTCDTPGFYLSQGGPTQLLAGTLGTGVAYTSPLGPTATPTYNALGFDQSNGYMYAMAIGGAANDLLKIDGSGNYTSLGAVTGFIPTNHGPNAGAFDAAGDYWFTTGGTSTFYEITSASLAGSPPQTATEYNFKHKAVFEPDDWSFDGGYMWGLSGDTLYRVVLATGAITTYPAPTPASTGGNTGTYGASWTFGNGNLGFSNNHTGEIYQINPFTATPSLVSQYAGPIPPNDNNDGTACVSGNPEVSDTDLGIVKSGPATVLPGNLITWTLTVTNHGPGNSSGFVVNDDVPSAITNVAATPGCTVTGNDVQCAEGALPDGNSFTITVTGTAPNIKYQDVCVTNTATVTANETDPNSANNTSSLRTCVTPVIHIIKSANVTQFTGAGTVVTYTYQVTDTSVNEALTNVTVTDPMKGLSPIDCGDGSNVLPELDTNSTATCTATYTTTQTDVKKGSITNTAYANGDDPSGSVVDSNKSTVTIPYVAPQTSIKCTNLSGNESSTATLSGCTGNTGGSSMPIAVTTLTSGGTITWSNGKATTVGAPTSGSGTLCPTGSAEDDVLKGTVTADTTGSVTVPSKYNIELCIDPSGNFSLPPGKKAKI